MIKFHSAKDANGKTVHISEVTKDNRARYYCIGCAQEMSAVLGDKREHHFRHKGEHCSWESYLHKLAKIRLKERFYSQKEFIIKYGVEYKCDKFQNCKWGSRYRKPSCNGKGIEVVDLKKYYDTCKEEVFYNGFIADLLLSSSEDPNRPPVFLEISVTHDCEPEKVNSGIRIIELKITNEEDVNRQLFDEEALSLNTSINRSKTIQELPPVRFYNFQKIIKNKHPLRRFWVYKDEKGVLRGADEQDGMTCHEVCDNHRNDSLYEVAIPVDVLNQSQKEYFHSFGMVKAIKQGIEVRLCALCKNVVACGQKLPREVVDNQTGEKKLQSVIIRVVDAINNKWDTVPWAVECKSYALNHYYVNQELQRFSGIPCKEWVKPNPDKES